MSPTKDAGGKDSKDPSSATGKDGNDKFGVGGRYNFIDVIIDGISVQIDQINISLVTPDLAVSVGLKGLHVFSPTADWAQASSLKETRVKNKALNTITLFKQVKLQDIDLAISLLNPPQADVGGGWSSLGGLALTNFVSLCPPALRSVCLQSAPPHIPPHNHQAAE